MRVKISQLEEEIIILKKEIKEKVELVESQYKVVSYQERGVSHRTSRQLSEINMKEFNETERRLLSVIRVMKSFN